MCGRHIFACLPAKSWEFSLERFEMLEAPNCVNVTITKSIFNAASTVGFKKRTKK